jgi:hypothetical protein
MKAKHLIKILETVDPESDVDLQIGSDNDQAYRDLCAMAELTGAECLSYLGISEARIYEAGDKTCVSLTLQQWNYGDLESAAADFSETYKRKED